MGYDAHLLNIPGADDEVPCFSHLPGSSLAPNPPPQAYGNPAKGACSAFHRRAAITRTALSLTRTVSSDTALHSRGNSRRLSSSCGGNESGTDYMRLSERPGPRTTNQATTIGGGQVRPGCSPICSAPQVAAVATRDALTRTGSFSLPRPSYPPLRRPPPRSEGELSTTTTCTAARRQYVPSASSSRTAFSTSLRRPACTRSKSPTGATSCAAFAGDERQVLWYSCWCACVLVNFFSRISSYIPSPRPNACRCVLVNEGCFQRFTFAVSRYI